MPRHVHYKRHRYHHPARYDRHVSLVRVSTVGAQEVSADGSTGWAAAIPAASLKVDTAVDYYVRINPTEINPADTGAYKYSFALVGELDSNGGNTAGIGGIQLTWQGNLAHITGKVPADQVGKKITIVGFVTDSAGVQNEATHLVGTWTA